MVIRPWRVLVSSADEPFAATVGAVLQVQLPGSTCERVQADELRAAPNAEAMVIDARDEPTATVDRARRMRAMGFGGALVLVGSAVDDALGAPLGIGHAAPHRLPEELMAALTTGMEQTETPFADAVRQSRRLVAAGQVALGLQHAVNNPLAAILAETQLMQLEPSSVEQQAALERIVVMCRRMVVILRSLDGIGERKI